MLYFFGRRKLQLPANVIKSAVERMFVSFGIFVIFLVLNFGIRIAIVLIARQSMYGIQTSYVVFLFISLIQALVFQNWLDHRSRP
jgi:hypothetical protein